MNIFSVLFWIAGILSAIQMSKIFIHNDLVFQIRCSLLIMSQKKHPWQKIPWQKVLQEVRQAQAEIVKAEQAGNQRRVFRLQDRLVRLRSARLLAVRQVMTNSGRHTAGVDGELWNTPQRKMQAVERLRTDGYNPQPARRVYIPKDGGRTRPLGILTMYDRAMQALHHLALDPIAETRADPHSYGFRKNRSTADAIMCCAEIFAEKEGPQWILEADIEECFDTICHEWLLKHIPLEKTVLRSWLKAGYVEKGRFHKSTKGLPQGGIISPTLANMALDGMEAMLVTYFHHSQESRDRSKIYVVRYADDFIVAGARKNMLQKEVKSLLANFLQERGMRFSARKTHISHITRGFDFLGYHLIADTSLFGGYTLKVTPSFTTLRKVVDRMQHMIQKRPNATPADLIQMLNPIIRGWVGHYTHLEQRGLFHQLDDEVTAMLLTWAKQRHPSKRKGWIMKTYFTRGKGRNWVFSDQQGHTIYRAWNAPVTTHVPIEPTCNVYDPKWAAYLKQREKGKTTTN